MMETVRISSNQLYLRRAQDHIELSLNIEIKDVFGYNRFKVLIFFLDDDEKNTIKWTPFYFCEHKSRSCVTSDSYSTYLICSSLEHSFLFTSNINYNQPFMILTSKNNIFVRDKPWPFCLGSNFTEILPAFLGRTNELHQ